SAITDQPGPEGGQGPGGRRAEDRPGEGQQGGRGQGQGCPRGRRRLRHGQVTGCPQHRRRPRAPSGEAAKRRKAPPDEPGAPSLVLAGIIVIPPRVVAYTSARVWHPSRGYRARLSPFRLDVSSPKGDAAEQGEPNIGVPLTGSAVFGYTDHLRCTLTSSVSQFASLGFCRGAFGVRAVIVPRQVRKDPCWQHRAAPPPRILVPAACPSRGSTNP